MKKLALAAICGIALSTSALPGCVGWPEANKDVRELRAILTEERGFLEPKNPTHAAMIQSLDAKIDSILDHMDAITR